MIKQKENEKKFKIDQVKTIVKGYVIETYHIEASLKEEALKLFEEQKDDLESVDSDIYIKDTEWAENEIEERTYQNRVLVDVKNLRNYE